MNQEIILLDDYLIVKIAKFLDLKQLAMLFMLSRQFNRALQAPELWKTLLNRYFKQCEIPQNIQIDYYKIFKDEYKKTDWTDHITKILKRCNLNPEVWIQSKIRDNYQELESQFVGVMPLSYLKFYEQMNESILSKVYQPNRIILFFGGFKAYNEYYIYGMCNKVQKILQKNQNQEEFYQFAKLVEGEHVMVDIGNYFGFGNEALFIQLNTFQDNKYYYIMNRNLRSFLDDRIAKDEKEEPINEHVNYYDILDTLIQPGSDTITQGIRIRATAKFCPQIQQQNKFVYQIRVSNEGVTSHFKLKSREWKIQYEQHLENVQGPGVIGFYPEVKQGSEDFVYESCCYIDGMNGQISGAFIFEDLINKTILRAVINPFPLRLNHNEALVIVNPNNQITLISDGRNPQ